MLDRTCSFWTTRCERIAWKKSKVMPKKGFSAKQIVTLQTAVSNCGAATPIDACLVMRSSTRSRLDVAPLSLLPECVSHKFGRNGIQLWFPSLVNAAFPFECRLHDLV